MFGAARSGRGHVRLVAAGPPGAGLQGRSRRRLQVRQDLSRPALRLGHLQRGKPLHTLLFLVFLSGYKLVTTPFYQRYFLKMPKKSYLFFSFDFHPKLVVITTFRILR